MGSGCPAGHSQRFVIFLQSLVASRLPPNAPPLLLSAWKPDLAPCTRPLAQPALLVTSSSEGQAVVADSPRLPCCPPGPSTGCLRY